MQNPLYIKYHDEEWGKPNFNEKYLFEMLILESFQAGLSWECVLNKRKDFKKAYDNFDINKICKPGFIEGRLFHNGQQYLAFSPLTSLIFQLQTEFIRSLRQVVIEGGISVVIQF